MTQTTETTLIISSGQYEQACDKYIIKHKTERGLMRRARQLSEKHSVYGDNWVGWIPARVAIAHPDDEYGDNDIIGGQWCNPANGWLDL